MVARKRAAPPAPRATVRTFTQEDIDAAVKLAKLEQATHDIKGIQQNRVAAEVFAAKAPVGAPVPLQQRLSMFQTVIAIMIGCVGLGGFVLAGISTWASYQVQGRETATRISALESWRTEMVALNLPLRLQQLEQNNDTARRIRDQQFQGLADQIAQLRQSDTAAGAQNQQLIQSNVQLQTRMEDISRQLAEIKAQLNRGAYMAPPAQRNDSYEEPAVWLLPHRIL